MFLSVIIPVYNVELYLRQCIDSVIRQNIENIEIILVDDGSPDKCPQICDEYAEQYEYITVIHKKNGGLSSARNAGLDAAKGEYIIFLDSDDWWNPDVSMNKMLVKVRENKETDMFLFTSLDYIEGDGYYKRTEHKKIPSISTTTPKDYYQGLLNNGNLEVAAYTKIIKKEFLQKNKLYFKDGLLSEDNEWILRLLRVLNKVEIIDMPLYIFRMNRKGSITNSIKQKNIVDLLQIIENSLDFYRKNKDKSYMKLELCYCSYLWFSALGLNFRLPPHERNNLNELFLKTRAVCTYSSSRKTKLCYALYRVLGHTCMTSILGSYIKLKNKLHLYKRKI